VALEAVAAQDRQDVAREIGGPFLGGEESGSAEQNDRPA
jgi:hypothetical protein